MRAMKTYGVITPARDEETFLPGLIESMVAQSRRPDRWIIVDDGSTDSTPMLLDEAARRHEWISVHHVRRTGERELGGETALQRFLAPGLWGDVDVVFRVDADITFKSDFVESLLEEFDRDPRLGIASATLYEPDQDGWREMRTPRFHAHGASKMYSHACLEAIGGVEVGLGWDTTMRRTPLCWASLRAASATFTRAIIGPREVAGDSCAGAWRRGRPPINADIRPGSWRLGPAAT